jgi:hypothetical protein
MNTRLPWAVAALGLVVGAVGCDDSPPPSNPFAAPSNAAKQPPPINEPIKPKGPPEFGIDTISPRVGFSRVVLKRDEDRANLSRELADVKEYIDGKDVPVIIDRKAPMSWVVLYIDELAKLGAKTAVVTTETRAEFAKDLRFTPQSKAGSVPSCSVVAIVMEDRGTAVWKLSGGAAARREKGFAGPDLSMTADTLTRFAKGCKESRTVFVSAAEPIEWGLTYDLAASAKHLGFWDAVVLLKEIPVAGRPVEL